MSVMGLDEVRRDHNIKKRGRFAVPRFCGWPELVKYYKKCSNPEVAGLFATLFETGCRISEALQLRRDMFRVEDEWITVYRVPVLKKKQDAPIGDRYRNIPIHKAEPLARYMMQYVESLERELLFTKTRQWAWYNIVSVDQRWWCHRIRSERATQLHVEYGYEVPELMKFFNWSEAKEALEYVKLDPQDLKDRTLKALE